MPQSGGGQILQTMDKRHYIETGETTRCTRIEYATKSFRGQIRNGRKEKFDCKKVLVSWSELIVLLCSGISHRGC